MSTAAKSLGDKIPNTVVQKHHVVRLDLGLFEKTPDYNFIEIVKDEQGFKIGMHWNNWRSGTHAGIENSDVGSWKSGLCFTL